MSEKVSLRVLVLCPQPYFMWRGSPLRVSFDVRALAELGHRVDLLTMPVGEEHPQEGVRHFRAPNFIRAKKLAIGPSAAKALLDGAILWKGWELARKNGYDVFHGIEDAGPIAALLAKRFKRKMVFEKHSDAASYKKGLVRNAVLGAYRAAERFSIRSADAVIGTGEALAEQARAVAPGKAVYAIHDIPSSLAEAGAGETAAARAELGLPEGSVLALYVGSFAVYQGIDLLFEAAGRALAEEGRLHLAVVGGTEAEIAARRAELAARGAGVAERVHFLGFRHPDALPAVLGAADLLLSPRKQGENTPLKLLDYAKAGNGAIVACDIPANRRILGEGRGALTEPTAEGFAGAMVALARDGAKRRALAAAAHGLYLETYNYGHFKQLLGEVYAGLG